jgi:predicted kinase
MKSLQLQKPHFIVVVGIPGAGKSFFATQFSDMFNAPYLDYSKFTKIISDQQAAADITSYVFGQLLKSRQTIILEGTGSKIDDRKDLSVIAKKHGYEVLYVWVQTDPQTAEQRAVTSKTATMSQNEFSDKARQFEMFQKGESYVVVSGRHTYATQAKVVLKKLVIERPGQPIVVNRAPSSSNRISG